MPIPNEFKKRFSSRMDDDTLEKLASDSNTRRAIALARYADSIGTIDKGEDAHLDPAERPSPKLGFGSKVTASADLWTHVGARSVTIKKGTEGLVMHDADGNGGRYLVDFGEVALFVDASDLSR